MLFEKAKVVRAAEKYLALGKIPAAIKEYEQLVANDPEDLTALNMLGDLSVRVGNNDEAIACFLRIADHYREQGFAPKAIAMYRKIERLNPRDPVIAEKLADLYGMQGLVVDARAQYLIVAEAHNRAGDSRKGLAVLGKIADLDPENTDVRIKLAEGYLKEGFTADATRAYVVAGEHLLARGESDGAVDAFARALHLDPHDQTILNGVLAAHAARGTADEAAEIIERAVAENPDDSILLDMLAHAYVSAEDPAGAERAMTALTIKDPANYSRFIEVAQLYLKAGDLDAAVSIMNRIAEQMLSGRQETPLLELVDEALALNPEHVAGLRLLVRILWWQRDMEKLRAALERLLEASQAAKLVEDERYALTQLTRLVPDQPHYFERLRELGGASEESSDEAISPLPTPEEPVPTFESFQAGSTVPTETPANAAPNTTSTEFEWNSVAEVSPADPSASSADLDQSWATSADSPITPGGSEADAAAGFQEVDFNTVVAEELPDAPPADEVAADPSHLAVLRQEIESVDFYINQGYADIALDTLDLLERQFGSHQEIDARRKTLKNLPAAAEAGISGETTTQLPADPAGLAQQTRVDTPAPAAEPAPVVNAPVAPPPPPVDTGLADLMAEFRTEDEEPAPSEGDFETHFNLGLAYKDMYMQDEAVEEFQVAAGLVSPGDGTARYLQCCNMLGHCFQQKGLPRLAVMWFKKGLASPGHTEDEYQALRYDLGSAYEEMGSIDQAIEAFSEVYGVNVSYRGVAERLQQLQARKNGDKQETPATL